MVPQLYVISFAIMAAVIYLFAVVLGLGILFSSGTFQPETCHDTKALTE
jgi:hypothetical protein